MIRSTVIIQGHPDPKGGHFGHALADAYAKGVSATGRDVHIIDVAKLDFPLLHSKEEFETGVVPPSIRAAQDAITHADHLVILYPLWLGSMPAILKGFLEQTFRPGFALGKTDGKGLPQQLLKGKSARIVVTMGMPSFIYRWYFGAHSLKSLERNILRFCGIGPIKETLIGGVEGPDAAKRATWLAKMTALGHQNT